MNLADLIADADRSIRPIGTVNVTGTLTDWHTLPSGLTTGQLTSNQPTDARIRVIAGRHASTAANDDLTEAGRTVTQPGEVTIHGELGIHPQYGLQLTLFRL